MDKYDIWKTTPPEPEESKCRCEKCEEELQADEYFYMIEGYLMCENCAEEWFNAQRNTVTWEMAYGD